MMNCWRSRPLLTAFLDDALPTAERAAVARHLERCGECAAQVARFAAVPAIPKPSLDSVVEEGMWDALHQAIDRSANAAGAHASALATPASFQRPGWLGALGGRLRWGEVALPVPAAVAYAAVLALLVGWGVYSHERIQVLSTQIQERDGRINFLQAAAETARPVRPSSMLSDPLDARGVYEAAAFEAAARFDGDPSGLEPGPVTAGKDPGSLSIVH